MPQTSLALLAVGFIGGLFLWSPGNLAAPQAQRLAGAAGARPATGCDLRPSTGEGACRIAAQGQDGAADDAYAENSVADDLDDCAPFTAMAGDRALDFDTAHGKVMETAAPTGPQARGAPPMKRLGTFSTTERAGKVVVTLAGVRREYSLIIPADGTQCILALGAPNAVNLEQSWFGQILDGPDADPPSYQHATAPRSSRTGGHRALI